MNSFNVEGSAGVSPAVFGVSPKTFPLNAALVASAPDQSAGRRLERPRRSRSPIAMIALAMVLPIVSAFADGTNDPATTTNVVATVTNAFTTKSNVVAITSGLPDVAGSVVRMLAGLAFVLALFFGGVWLFKNWQRVSRVKSKSKLNVFEARSLGPRQALYVVGYNEQRFLVAASQAGISLISALPEAAQEADTAPAVTNGASAFAQVLQNVLGRK